MATSGITLPIDDIETAQQLPRVVLLPGRSLRRLFIKIFALSACVILWQLASTYKVNVLVNFANVPAPSAVADAAWYFFHSSKLLSDLQSSLVRIFVGFGIATALAIPLGLVIGRSKLLEDVMLTPIEILRPIPAVAWIPLAILMFASAEESMVFICFIGAFYPILLNTIHGVNALDRRLILASQTLGARKWAIFREVILPGAFPSIVTGLSIGMGTCWFSLVTAEMISGQFGIGYQTWEAYTLQDYPDIVIGMLLIGVLGMASSLFVRLVGKSLMPWHAITVRSLR